MKEKYFVKQKLSEFVPSRPALKTTIEEVLLKEESNIDPNLVSPLKKKKRQQRKNEGKIKSLKNS